MKTRVVLATVGLLLAAVSCPRGLSAAQYVIDPTRSEIVVQLFKTGIGAALAHDHVVRAKNFTAQIQLDPAAPTGAQITVEVDATTLAVDEPETRRKYQLPGNLSDANRREIQQTLESEGQLHVRRYPKIRFRSTHIASEREGQYFVTGRLELRGVTQTIFLAVQTELQQDLLRAKGSGRFLQSSFGYQPYSAFLGSVQNQDEVLLHVDIVAVRQ